MAESLYLQCDREGNQYVLLEEIVDHRRLPAAIKLSDQKIICANGKTYWSVQLLIGNFAANGRMALCLGRTLLTSRSLTLLKLPNMLRYLALTMNQLSTGGLLTSWEKGTRIVSPVRKSNLCYLKQTHKFGIELPKTIKKNLNLTRRMVIPSGLMPLPRRWRTFASPSKSYLKGNLCQLVTRRYPAIWFLTSKWKISNAKPD